MKRSTLIIGLAYLICGLILAAAVLVYLDTPIDPLLCGLGGAGVGCGLTMLTKYFYWTRPQRAAQYLEKLEEESIDLHDERKEQLRNRAGRYAYVIGLLTVCVSILVISTLGHMGLVPGAKWMTIYLAIYLIVQYVLGIAIYRHFTRKY